MAERKAVSRRWLLAGRRADDSGNIDPGLCKTQQRVANGTKEKVPSTSYAKFGSCMPAGERAVLEVCWGQFHFLSSSASDSAIGAAFQRCPFAGTSGRASETCAPHACQQAAEKVLQPPP